LQPVQKFATGMLEKISIFLLSLSRGMLTMQLLVQVMGQSWGLIYYRYFVTPEKQEVAHFLFHFPNAKHHPISSF
jgi:hypothetical protein